MGEGAALRCRYARARFETFRGTMALHVRSRSDDDGNCMLIDLDQRACFQRIDDI